MGEILRFAWYNIRRMLLSPRLYLSLFVVYACLRLCFGSVCLSLDESGRTLQAVELFIFASGNRIPQWILTFGMLLLLCDVPFLHNGISIYLIRTSRFRWLAGQVLFCLIMVMGYLLAVEIMLLSMSGERVSFLNEWSDTIELASRITSGASLLNIKIIFDFPINVVLGGTPYTQFALTLLYDTLLLMFFSLICFACNVKWKTGVGCFVVVSFLVLRLLVDEYGEPVALLFSPCNLASPGSRVVTPVSVGYTVAFFLCVCGFLFVWGWRQMKYEDM